MVVATTTTTTTTTMTSTKQLISVQPEELRFQFELEKQSFCDLKVTNNTEQNVAFKVKTTSPKKYFVRPNTGVMHPWDSCVIRVTLQAQRDYPPEMQCRDKFLLQSTVVTPHSEVDDLPQDAFTKDSGRVIEEIKLKVVYVFPNSSQGNGDGDSANSGKGLKVLGDLSAEDNQALQQAKEQRDAAVRQTQQLKQELEMLKRRRLRKSNTGFSFKFVILVAIIGIMLGFLLKLSLSSPTPA